MHYADMRTIHDEVQADAIADHRRDTPDGDWYDHISDDDRYRSHRAPSDTDEKSPFDDDPD